MRVIERDSADSETNELLDAAKAAGQKSFAKWSKFRVGAALKIRDAKGDEHVVTGTNFETDTYRSVCAEKAALMSAYFQHSTELEDGTVQRPEVLQCAVYSHDAESPQQPCGDCRQVLFEASPGIVLSCGCAHSPLVHKVSLRELLPHAFSFNQATSTAEIVDSTDPVDYVVHLPIPKYLKADAEARAALLKDVSYIILVGSPSRARQVAAVAHREFGAITDENTGCYVDLSVPGRDETTREYALYVSRFENGPNIAVVSHGIGYSGVEIVLSEVPALMHVAQGYAPSIHGVVRCGTRGTLSQVPLGCIALSTLTYSDEFDKVTPSPELTELIRGAAVSLGMSVFGEETIEAPDTKWPEVAQKILVEGAGLSSLYFWRTQGRPIYRASQGDKIEHRAYETEIRRKQLEGWYNMGIRWIEMEDYAVHELAQYMGYPSVTMGAVIAHRRTADGVYQLDYSKEAYVKSEMIPTHIAIEAFKADHASR